MTPQTLSEMAVRDNYALAVSCTDATREDEDAKGLFHPRVGNRVLFICGDAPFFITHFFELARALLQTGRTIDVATPVDAGSGRGDEDAVHRIEALGITVHRIGLKRASVNPFNEMLLLHELNQLIGVLKPTLIHCLGAKPILYGGAIARARGLPALHSVIGLGLPFMRKGVVATLRRALILKGFAFAFRNARSRITVEHELDRATIASAVGGQSVTRTFGVGVDLSLFRPRDAGIISASPVVMLGARLIETKGIRDFVEAARRIKSRNLPVRFVLQCQLDLHNRHAIQAEEVEAWAQEGVIEWWGQTTDMPSALQKADVFCLPTYYREGTPKALLEAAATGLPIVTTDIPGCRDVVRHGENGLLIPPRDVDALEAALLKAVEDKDFRATAGKKSREFAVQHLSVRSFIQTTIDLYEEAAGGHWAQEQALASPL